MTLDFSGRKWIKILTYGRAKNKTVTCERIKDKQGNIVTGSAVVASLNASVGRDLAMIFPKNKNIDVPIILDVQTQCTFRFVGMKEDRSVIQGLKNKSTCVANVNMKTLKDAMMLLLVEITHLINVCLDKLIMPAQWKIGTVSPVPKAAPSLNIGGLQANLRPTST